MNRATIRTSLCLIGIVLAAATGARADQPADGNWPSFRGAFARGVADGPALPTAWNVPKNEGVAWKQEIAGLGHSSPVIWGDRLFVTSAIKAGGKRPRLKVGLYGDIGSIDEEVPHTWRVYCLNARTGEVLWRRDACEGVPKIKRHPKSSHASSTPATDGQHVVAFFGSEGLYCYDMDGKLIWKKDLGLLDAGFYVVKDAQWGFGSSPVIHAGRVVVQCDVQANSFLAAFDVTNGREIWRTPRDDVPTWGTPTVHVGDDGTQIIVNGYRHIGGYDFADGKELWKLRGGGDIPVPTPVVWNGLAFITNAHGFMAPIYAIRASARGEIKPVEGESAGAAVAWWTRYKGNYMQTPIVYADRLYTCQDNGVMSAYDAATGRELFRQRLGRGGSGFTASPVAGDRKLYFTSEEGKVYVVAASGKFDLLSTCDLGDECMATPAISGGRLFFRTRRFVVAVGPPSRAEGAEPAEPAG